MRDALMDQLLARAPVYDLVFSCLSPRSLVLFAQTCRAALLAVVEFKSRAFNINRHLSRYFSDPIAFRSLQARTNTLVSGSNALQFLDRTFYPKSDLDLYTHPGHSFEVARFLVKAEGYRYVPRETQNKDWKVATNVKPHLSRRRVFRQGGTNHGYPTTDITAVWSFEKTVGNSDGEDHLKIQIIEARSSPLEAILGFHSTCVMNFISSDAAYSLYPIATFENRSSLGMPVAQTSRNAIQKYVRRGWRIYFVPTPNDATFFVERARWVADKHTWRLPLDQTGVQERPPLSAASAPLTRDPVLFNGWKLTFWKQDQDIDERETRGYKCFYYPVKVTVFRYNYAIPDESVQLAIREWAYQQGLASHSSISKKDWVWFDADMPHFLQTKESRVVFGL